MRAEALASERRNAIGAAERDLARFVGEILACCPAIRSIWRTGASPSSDARLLSPFTWDLIVFGDDAALQQLQASQPLHRADVRLRVITDGDHFECAWGAGHWRGSLAAWEWRQTSVAEAFYNELASGARYLRTRRRAVRLWHSVVPNAADSVH